MKKIFIILFLFMLYNVSKAQTTTQFLMPVISGVVAPPPPAYTTFWRLNFTNEYQTSSPTGWQNIYATGANIATSGAVSFPTIYTSTGASPTLSFTNGSGWVGYYNPRSPGSLNAANANTGVFPDQIVGFGWQFNNGATFTIGGLTAGVTYTFFFLSNANPWEADVVNFSINGVASSNINSADNFGSSATNPWWNDGSLVKVSYTPTGTTAVITCNIASGTYAGALNALVVAR